MTHIVPVPRRVLCGARINWRDHEDMRQKVARTSDDATCPKCRELRGLDPVAVK